MVKNLLSVNQAADHDFAVRKIEKAAADAELVRSSKAARDQAARERAAPPAPPSRGFFGRHPGRAIFGGRSRKLGTRFNRCVKSVRSTVTARKGSTKEGAAIAICTTSVLYPRGRTLKRYRKGRLVTQRRRR
jgi:hypothetical protein